MASGVSQGHAKRQRKKLRPRKDQAICSGSYPGNLLLGSGFRLKSFLSTPLHPFRCGVTVLSPAQKSVSCWKVPMSLWQVTNHTLCLSPAATDQISTTPSPSLCHFKMRGFSSEQRYRTPRNHGVRTGHVIVARYELTKMAVGGFGCQRLFHSMTARNEPHDEAICSPDAGKGHSAEVL